jgi:hypothetical protein
MFVLMVNIRIVFVRVLHYFVFVMMHMRFSAIPVEVMIVLMVGVMGVGVSMIQRGMFMLVFMAFRDVEPDTCRHQSRGKPEPELRLFAQQRQRQRGADKRRG